MLSPHELRNALRRAHGFNAQARQELITNLVAHRTGTIMDTDHFRLEAAARELEDLSTDELLEELEHDAEEAEDDG